MSADGQHRQWLSTMGNIAKWLGSDHGVIRMALATRNCTVRWSCAAGPAGRHA